MKPVLRRVLNAAGSRSRSRSAAMMEGGRACARVCGLVRVWSGRVKQCTAAAARWRGDGAWIRGGRAAGACARVRTPPSQPAGVTERRAMAEAGAVLAPERAPAAGPPPPPFYATPM
jgi:hypothetical protein